MTCSRGTLNADCTFCECALDLNAQAFSSHGQPLSNVSIRHTAAPLTELFFTSSNGLFVLNDVCDGDSYVAKRTGYIDEEFVASPSLQSITMQVVGTLIKLSSVFCFSLQFQK